MKRREFLSLLGLVVTWPLAAYAQGDGEGATDWLPSP